VHKLILKVKIYYYQMQIESLILALCHIVILTFPLQYWMLQAEVHFIHQQRFFWIFIVYFYFRKQIGSGLRSRRHNLHLPKQIETILRFSVRLWLII
jgi:hypothetical protein